MIEWIDAHAHFDELASSAELLAQIGRAERDGVAGVVAIGATKGMGAARQIPEILSLTEAPRGDRPRVVAACGVHPHDAKVWDASAREELRALIVANPRVTALGETGLDYHYKWSPVEVQERVFLEQLELASELDVPVVLHVREAHEEARRVLSAAPPKAAVVHCFTGEAADADWYLDQGFYLSFSGILTFGSADVIRDVARAAPADRIMVETDAPYLTPIPHRNVRPNEPRYVVHTARRLAEIRGVSLKEIAALTTANARRFFWEAGAPTA
jgi:TatD DNase family protein